MKKALWIIAPLVAAVVWLSSRVIWVDEEADLRDMVAYGECPGCVTYTLEEGREEWSCLGWADVGAKRQMYVGTVFRICSMTKSLVGTLAAILADRGEIDLDDRVSRSFPEFTDEKAAITLRQCLSMTAGFEELSPTMLASGVNSQDPADVVREMAVLPLEAPPGSRFIYSNPSFEIAGAVIERVTGRKLEDLLTEHLFRPLRMVETTFHPTDEMLARLATVYHVSKGKPCRAVQGPLMLRPPYSGPGSHVCASGGLFSTPRDILKFYRMLLNEGKSEDGRQVLTPKAFAILRTKQTPPAVPEEYSLGLFRHGDWLGHGGAYGTIAECDLAHKRLQMIFSQVCGRHAREFLGLWRRASDGSFAEASLNGSRYFTVDNE